MRKQVKRLLHLLIGAALLAAGAYFLWGAAIAWKKWWREQSALDARRAKAAKAKTASDDPILGAADLKVYGVLAQTGEPKGEGDSEPAPKNGPPLPLDHVSANPAAAARSVLHKRISVKTYLGVAFEVPPHEVHPWLRGTFRSVATPAVSGEDSMMEVELMSEQQFDDLVHKRAARVMCSANPSNRGKIDWPLSTTFDDPEKYYLVFHNADEQSPRSVVEADFSLVLE